MKNSEAANQKESPKSKLWILLFLLIAMLVLLLLWQQKKAQDDLEKERQKALLAQQDSLRQDSLQRAQDSLAQIRMRDSLQWALDSLRLDSLRQDSLRRDSLHLLRTQDSLRWLEQQNKKDSSAQSRHSVSNASSASADSLPPHPQLLPPGGRYFGNARLELKCPEAKCSAYLSVGDSSAPQAAPSFTLSESADIWYYAIDSAGNRSPWQKQSYVIEAADNKCGKNMVPIQKASGEFCMDVYEWPNKAGAEPLHSVTQEKAAQYCAEVGKRLCTADEWQAACEGPQKNAYPYGSSYSGSKCVTSHKGAKRSGRSKECRSYYGVYDLSGNLWEWTGTTYTKRPSYYYAAGGSYKTQVQSTCSEKKFSFYPQNQYPIVGFRCCK
jgi:hypothetical protein